MTTLLALPPRKAFTSDNRQWAWDSTSLTAAKKCPRYYYYTILHGWRPKSESPHLKFGIAFHEALEQLDQQRTKGPLTEEHLHNIILNTLEAVGHRDVDGVWQPWRSAEPKKNVESLIRAIVWYFDQYKVDPFTSIQLEDGSAAVELSFRFEMPNGMLYCGHLDRLGEYGGQVFWMDRKTTGGALTQNFFNQFSPGVQTYGYTLASKLIYKVPAVGGIIDAMQVLVGSVRFARHPISATDAQLEEWLTGTMLTCQDADRWHDQKYWPMNETACTMYGGCRMLEICQKDPSVRDRFLVVNYEQEGWDPLKVRGSAAQQA